MLVSFVVSRDQVAKEEVSGAFSYKDALIIMPHTPIPPVHTHELRKHVYKQRSNESSLTNFASAHPDPRPARSAGPLTTAAAAVPKSLRNGESFIFFSEEILVGFRQRWKV